MASRALRRRLKVTTLGPADASVTIVYINGFIGAVTWAACLSLGIPPQARPDSMFGPLLATGKVRLILVEHPGRPIDPDVDFYRITELLPVHGPVILCGLSRGGQVIHEYYRWLMDNYYGSEPEFCARLKVVFMCMPTCAEELVNQRFVKLVERWRMPYTAGQLMRLVGGLFARSGDLIQLLRQHSREGDIRSLKKYYRRSTWVIATMRALAEFRLEARLPLDGTDILVANVENDDAVHVGPALQNLRTAYPGCHEHTIRGTTGHARVDIDTAVYQGFWHWVVNQLWRDLNITLD